MYKIISLIAALLISGFVQTAQAAPTSSREVFPKLPPSVTCSKEAVAGVWKLLMVYEVPSGNEIKLYTERPLQYLVFEADSRYGDYISPLRAINTNSIRNYVIADKEPRQFTLNDAGILYIYKAGIPIDSLACFIAAENSGPFEAGQLLIMPPKNLAKGRMVKIYQKMPLEGAVTDQSQDEAPIEEE